MKFTLLTFFLLLFFFESFSQPRLDSGLVAYYPFNGNANDESSNGNNPVFNNATLAADRFGNANSAYSFNGIDNYIQIPNNPSLNPASQISLCVFVKPMGFYKGSCHGNSIFMKGDADYLPGNYLLRFDDNAFTFGNNCNTGVVDTLHQNFYSINAAAPAPGYTPYINEGQWYCVAYTYDGTTGKFYVDNVLINAELKAGVSFSNAYDLFLGRLNNPAFPYWFNGVLDEIRIYNRAISQAEIFALCPSGALPVSLTKFDASVANKKITLNWNIENEDDIRNFTVERSITGHADFVQLGTIASKHIHAYSFVDKTAAINQNYYYRLAILAGNGSINYSAVKMAKINEKNNLMVVYPNPSPGTVTVLINGYKGSAKFSLLNSVGQVILQKNETIVDNNPLPLKLSKQPKGIYWLKVETNKERLVEKILIF